mmetsp:Transcript_66721/g.168342  ORF Transcript_66721/g.168342 Transcript_66721/m.168342 type:complete len:735 (-) Transcript_66721:94-2298(-)|eukprot:CAMPEP_0115229454 /NCGR_PEP_ID=MMETSP0270-20121206/32206_1 /TAXON_ID=71861 /ORGANISM="Scrippsiella trochoidea, Strain CCMP3099" /LENGTH=734 /DNA_ID=CAMNT_0002644011 /DNA_START=38 /DNA_END=2242 /DNA_ORIENTATION=+
MARSICLCLIVLLTATCIRAEVAGVEDTPVTRVVGLLKDMSKTLQKEMDEDEALYKEMACWCNNGDYEKKEAIEKSTAKIQELGSSIESLTASTAELSTNIKELEADVASDKSALAEATALREKQLKEFHGMEVDSIQAVENLKAALGVLAKHHDAPPESTVAGGAVFKSEQDSWSFLEVGSKDFPWSEAHEGSSDERTLANFMRRNGFDDDDGSTIEKPVAAHKFLQQANRDTGGSAAWSDEDTMVVKRALKSATAFVQSKQESVYFPAYNSQSGAIVGVMKQLKEEMEADLSEAQKREQERAADFAELRAAKKTQIADGEKMAELKEDQLAEDDNNLAEAKEDLGQEKKVLAEDQAFLKNLKEMCADADKNFEERKKARLTEMQAVAETIEILQGDEARDAMSSTFKGFVQIASSRTSSRRAAAAETLRRAARRFHNSELSVLASSVELDAFTKVKQAIDGMIAALKQQQADEVKKNDWCGSEIHENEMTTAKTEDHKADLEAKIGKLESALKSLEDEIADAKAQIAQLELDLQRASEDRKKENLEFQTTVADQTTTIAVLKKALDRLAKYYDFLQTGSRTAVSSATAAGQTPPVPQKEYKPNAGAGGVMEMIEKLIHDSADLMAESQKSEATAQLAYESLVADTNASVEALQKEIVSKTEAKTEAAKDKRMTESDLSDAVGELGELGKYNGELHKECDYLLKNFDLRQKARGEEVEALQQAKQILDGASLS